MEERSWRMGSQVCRWGREEKKKMGGRKCGDPVNGEGREKNGEKPGSSPKKNSGGWLSSQLEERGRRREKRGEKK